MASVTISFSETLQEAFNQKADLVDGKVPVEQLPDLGVGQSEIDEAIAAHEQASNPHPGYATDSDLTNAIAAHEQASNPHPGYATDSDLTNAIAKLPIISTNPPTTRTDGTPLQNGDFWQKTEDGGIPGSTGSWVRLSGYWMSPALSMASAAVSSNSDLIFNINPYFGMFLERIELAGWIASSTPNWDASNHWRVANIWHGQGQNSPIVSGILANSSSGVVGNQIRRVFNQNILSLSTPSARREAGIVTIQHRSTGNPTGAAITDRLRFEYFWRLVHP